MRQSHTAFAVSFLRVVFASVLGSIFISGLYAQGSNRLRPETAFIEPPVFESLFFNKKVSQPEGLSFDISLSNAGSPHPVEPGGYIVYTIKATNAGQNSAPTVSVNDVFPAGTSFVSAVVTQGTFTSDGSHVTASFGTIDGGSNATLILILLVDPGTPLGTGISNTATAPVVSGDTNPNNNSAMATRTVDIPTADVGLTKTANSPTVPFGGQITYTIKATNSGPDDATNVTVTDDLPSGTTFVNASVTQGSANFDGSTVTANFGTIPNGSNATLTITVSIGYDLPSGTVITNVALLLEAEYFDPNQQNDGASVDTTVTGGALVISELRQSGPGGSSDEYIEITNPTNSSITVHDVNNNPAIAGEHVLAVGWAVAASDGVVRGTIPEGTIIPAGGHYLLANSGGYSLGGYSHGTPDATYTQGIGNNAGVALFATGSAGAFGFQNRIDAVGSDAEGNGLYKEGDGYPAMNAGFGNEYAIYRKLPGGCYGSSNCPTDSNVVTTPASSSVQPVDFQDNATDFVFVSTSGGLFGPGINALLGAPGPQGSQSPIATDGAQHISRLDVCGNDTADPNFVRDYVPVPNGAQGTIEIRRTFTNSLQGRNAVTSLRFRVVDLTTFPPIAGEPVAELRVLSGSPVDLTVDRAPCFNNTTSDITVGGTTLEEPVAQPNGGGYNSSLNVDAVSANAPLTFGQSLDVNFRLGVQSPGDARFCVVAETIPATSGQVSCFIANTEATATTASEVSVSGRVLTSVGRGITNASVTVSGGSLAAPVRVVTDRGGSYTISGLEAGQAYVISVGARRFTFQQPSRLLSLSDNAVGVDFTASP